MHVFSKAIQDTTAIETSTDVRLTAASFCIYMQQCKFAKQAFRLPKTKSRACDHGCVGIMHCHRIAPRACAWLSTGPDAPSPRHLVGDAAARVCMYVTRVLFTRLLIYLCAAHATHCLLTRQLLLLTACHLRSRDWGELHGPGTCPIRPRHTSRTHAASLA